MSAEMSPAAVDQRRDRDLRVLTGGLIGAAAIWPLLPVHPPLACPLRAATGIPCPFCGMTRACVAAAHGDIVKSLSFNPGGIFVLALAVVLLLRPSGFRPPIWLLAGILGVLWIWNIGFNPTFHQLFLR